MNISTNKLHPSSLYAEALKDNTTAYESLGVERKRGSGSQDEYRVHQTPHVQIYEYTASQFRGPRVWEPNTTGEGE